MESLQITYKKFRLVLSLVISATLLSACAGTIPTDIPPGEAEHVIDTLQALPTGVVTTDTPVPSPMPTPTLTSVPPTVILPTASALPTQKTILPGATRISFAPGSTYGTARGTIGPGQTENFVLKALQGQPMLASVASYNNDVTMSITTESDTALLPASQGSSSWQGSLPATQNYYIQVIGGASDEEFSLWVSIPSRIQFDPGAVSATVSGQTVDGNIASYVVAAQGGQTMNVTLTPQGGVAALTIWGFSDGQPYIRAQMESTTFNMQLPSTQDYIIDVVPQGGQEVNFTLKVEIE